MTAPDRPDAADTWAPRPLQARLIRTVVVATPVLAALTVSIVAGRTLPRPAGPVPGIAWLVVLAALCGFAMAGTDRLVRRLLPLAHLYQLTLVFPDRAPSRFAVALRSGNVGKLERDARLGLSTDLGEAAVEALAFATALNGHDRGTRGHCERVRAYTELLAVELGLREDERNRLRWGALLHDVGKLTVPSAILNKPGKPTAEEWAVLSNHPAAGAELLTPLAEFLGDAANVAGQHHERWDGAGYPHRLAGNDISRSARIVAIADAYAVMTAARAYKRPMSHELARQELATCAGAQFDPIMVRAFLNISIGRLRVALGPLAALVNAPAFTAASAAPGVATAGAALSVAAAAQVVALPFEAPPQRSAIEQEVLVQGFGAPSDPVVVNVKAPTATQAEAGSSSGAAPSAPESPPAADTAVTVDDPLPDGTTPTTSVATPGEVPAADVPAADPSAATPAAAPATGTGSSTRRRSDVAETTPAAERAPGERGAAGPGVAGSDGAEGASASAGASVNAGAARADAAVTAGNGSAHAAAGATVGDGGATAAATVNGSAVSAGASVGTSGSTGASGSAGVGVNVEVGSGGPGVGIGVTVAGSATSGSSGSGSSGSSSLLGINIRIGLGLGR